MTATARARALHKRHPSWSAADIAKKLGVPTQRVQRALASTGKLGRPGAESRPVRLSADLLDRVQVYADVYGYSLRAWIEKILEDDMPTLSGVTRGVTKPRHARRVRRDSAERK